jgi:hypothetical protein
MNTFACSLPLYARLTVPWSVRRTHTAIGSISYNAAALSATAVVVDSLLQTLMPHLEHTDAHVYATITNLTPIPQDRNEFDENMLH